MNPSQITQPAQTVTLPGVTSVIVETSTLPPVTYTQTEEGTTYTTTLPASSVIVTRTVSENLGDGLVLHMSGWIERSILISPRYR